MLSQSQKETYAEKGYLVLPEFFTTREMESLKSEALKIVDDFDPESTRSVFSTKSQDTGNDLYFLESEDKVRCFFEEDAFSESGSLTQAKPLSINKIGHALHSLNPVFKAFSQSSTIAEIAQDLGMLEPEIRQSMYIFKQPKIGGEIRWHQDATYFLTKPLSVVTFWFAIEDATIKNGCLQVDKQGADFPLKEQFKRYQDDSTELVTLSDKPWPGDDRSLPLEVKAGSLVVFKGTLPHYSAANVSDKSRHAYTLHITSAETQYDKHNWLRAEPAKLPI